MDDRPRIFLDTSALFAGVLSEIGGSRLILKLGEAGVVRLSIGPRVLEEADRVFARKAPEAKAFFAIWLDVALVEVGKHPSKEMLTLAHRIVSYSPDAHVLAEALAISSDYFVTLDRKHFKMRALSEAPILIGTPGDCLAWLRERLVLGI